MYHCETMKNIKSLYFSKNMLKLIDKCPLCNKNSSLHTINISFYVLRQLWIKLYKIEIGGINNDIEIRLINCLDCGLLYYTPQLIADARLYDLLQENKTYYLQDKTEFMTALNFISSNDSVLEIGAGDGAFARKLDCKSYVGLELNKKAIGIAKRLGMQSNKLMLEENIEIHAISNKEKYDIVCFFQVLEHVSALRTFLTSSIDCLKKGGKLIVSVPSEDSFLAFERNNLLNAPPHHLTRWTTDCLKNLAGLFNLKIVKIEQDKLSDKDIVNYSMWLIQNMVCKLLKLKSRTMDYRFAVFPIRYAIRFMVFLPWIFIKCGKTRPNGHSVTVVYEK